MFRKATQYLTCAFAFALSFFAQSSWAQLNFVIDLDGTLIDRVSLASCETSRVQCFLGADGFYYRTAEGAGEFIQVLRQIPDANVSVFSASNEPRNLSVMEQLALPNGDFLKHAIGGRLFSKVHLRALDTESDCFRKDLTVVSTPDGLIDTVLVDDQIGYVMPGQEKSLVWVASYLSASNRLAAAMGIIDLALEESAAQKKPITEILYSLQWGSSFSPKGYRNKILSRATIERGYQRFVTVNPAYVIPPIVLPTFPSEEAPDLSSTPRTVQPEKRFDEAYLTPVRQDMSSFYWSGF